jgi:hypothetical protein
MINPKLFTNLNKLIEVALQLNECVNSGFKQLDGSLAKIKDGLKKCYNNCNYDDECAAA